MAKKEAPKAAPKAAAKAPAPKAADKAAKTDKKAAKPEKGMTKTELTRVLAEKSGLQRKAVAELLDIMMEVAYAEVKSGKDFQFPGLGKLAIVRRQAREGVHPQTKEKIKIPAKEVLKFRLSKVAKDSILPAGKK